MTTSLTCGVPPLGYAVGKLQPTHIADRTPAQARQWMDEQGLSKAELARRFGVTSSLVDAILRGSKPCKRGISHNIAVYLGLKRGQAVAAPQPNTSTRTGYARQPSRQSAHATPMARTPERQPGGHPNPTGGAA